MGGGFRVRSHCVCYLRGVALRFLEVRDGVGEVVADGVDVVDGGLRLVGLGRGRASLRLESSEPYVSHGAYPSAAEQVLTNAVRASNATESLGMKSTPFPSRMAMRWRTTLHRAAYLSGA